MSRLPRLLPLSFATLAALAAGCGSSGPTGAVGGAVTGPADDHCTVNGELMKTKVGMCMSPQESDGGAPSDDDGGAAPGPDYGDPLYNADGYDDECKYHVSWTSTPIRKDALVTFTLTLEGLDPAGAVKGADIDVEAFLGETHVAPNTNTESTETPADSGKYEIGPVKLDRSGEWVVRFHFFEKCADEPEDTPHGHVAFRINVP
jgi:hypothetical protein